MFLSAPKTSLATALAVLFALPLGSMAFAQAPASIADGERAAHGVIVNPLSQARPQAAVLATTEKATLADNERAAQRAIVDPPASGASTVASGRATFGSATLARGERAAREAIVGPALGAREGETYRRAHAADSSGTQAADGTSARGS